MSFLEETVFLPFLIPIIHSLHSSQTGLSKLCVKIKHSKPQWNAIILVVKFRFLTCMVPVPLFISPALCLSPLLTTLQLHCPFCSSLNLSILFSSQSPWSCNSLFPEYFFPSQDNVCSLTSCRSLHVSLTQWFPNFPFLNPIHLK